MREGWQVKSLDQLATVVNGGTPKTKVEKYWGGKNLWVTPAEMGKRKDPFINETKRTLSNEGLQNSSASLVPANSVILSTRAPIGHLVINTEPMAFNQGCRGMVPGDELDVKYLYYFLLGNIKLLNDLGTGATFKELSARKLKSVSVPYPALPEQKRIVAILDEAFAGIDTAIANTEKNLANARELFESYLNSVFSGKGERWVETKLKNICNIRHGFAFKSQFFVEKSDYVVLTPGSFFESGGFRDQGKKTKYYKGKIPDGYIMEKGNFLIAMTEQAAGLLGSSLIVPESNRYLHNQRLGLVELFDGVEWHNDFFFHQFNTRQFRDAVQATASGVKVRHTSPKKLGEIDICFPSTIVEQKETADKLNDLLEESKKLATIYQQKLESLNELKQSLLQKAFSGELTAEGDKLMDEAVA